MDLKDLARIGAAAELKLIRDVFPELFTDGSLPPSPNGHTPRKKHKRVVKAATVKAPYGINPKTGEPFKISLKARQAMMRGQRRRHKAAEAATK